MAFTLGCRVDVHNANIIQCSMYPLAWITMPNAANRDTHQGYQTSLHPHHGHSQLHGYKQEPGRACPMQQILAAASKETRRRQLSPMYQGTNGSIPSCQHQPSQYGMAIGGGKQKGTKTSPLSPSTRTRRGGVSFVGTEFKVDATMAEAASSNAATLSVRM
jgi:hypothetical protein